MDTLALHIGEVDMHSWGAEQRSFGADASNDHPCILNLGEVLGVHGDIVICIHEDWRLPMVVDFSRTSEWVLVSE